MSSQIPILIRRQITANEVAFHHLPTKTRILKNISAPNAISLLGLITNPPIMTEKSYQNLFCRNVFLILFQGL